MADSRPANREALKSTTFSHRKSELHFKRQSLSIHSVWPLWLYFIFTFIPLLPHRLSRLSHSPPADLPRLKLIQAPIPTVDIQHIQNVRPQRIHIRRCSGTCDQKRSLRRHSRQSLQHFLLCRRTSVRPKLPPFLQPKPKENRPKT
jgi:hypothetical protein